MGASSCKLFGADAKIQFLDAKGHRSETKRFGGGFCCTGGLGTGRLSNIALGDLLSPQKQQQKSVTWLWPHFPQLEKNITW